MFVKFDVKALKMKGECGFRCVSGRMSGVRNVLNI